jgi:eukaryotic-like serine/threonine-protein kinase
MDTSRWVKFGPFEVDPSTGELRKHGVPLKLQDQPAKVLTALLTRPGEVVSREELEKLLWPNGTFVDFGGGLNAAVNRLRRALSDSADNPRYVETLAKHGYRFIAPLGSPEPDTPASPLVRSAVGKDHSQRVMQAADSESPECVTVHGPPLWQRWLWPIAIAGVVTLTAFALWMARSPESARSYHLSLAAPDETEFVSAGTNAGNSALSPDGMMLAYSARTKGKMQIWVRTLESGQSRLLANTEGGYYPFWSTDNRSIGFFTGGELKRIDVTGGPPQTVCDAAVGRGGSWNSDGVILFSAATTNRLIMRVPARGGTPVAVTTLGGQDNAHYWPSFLPDGRHFLYVARSTSQERSAIWVARLDSAASRKPLVMALSNVAYAPPISTRLFGTTLGHLLFMRDRTLVAQPFNLSQLELKGDPVVVADGIDYAANIALGDFSVSTNGRVLVHGSGADSLTRAVWRDRTGMQTGVLSDAVAIRTPRLSPDGRMLAATRGESVADIWLTDLERRTESRLTSDSSIDIYPVWSPEGDRITYLSLASNPPSVLCKPANAGREAEVLHQDSVTAFPSDWSRDGRYLLLSQTNSKSQSDLMVLDLRGDRKLHPFLVTQHAETHGRFSPDGRWIAYYSDVSGMGQVYVQRFVPGRPASEVRLQVSTSGGSFPVWRGDGKELFYLSSDGMVMAVNCRTKGESLEASGPVALFRTVPATGLATTPYDVTSDGRRFLLVEPLHPERSELMTVIVNWQTRFNR